MYEELRALIRGSVQGVGFRATTYRYANRLGLVGTVRNLPDGRVEICVQGKRENLEKLMELLQREAFPEFIEEVEMDYHPIGSLYPDFRIIHG